MRTYTDIYKDYLAWMVRKTGNLDYEYDTFMNSMDKDTAHSILYKQILELCYDKNHGTYYFITFIVGGLEELGFPTPYRCDKLVKEWDTLIRNNKKLAVLCARGHGKTLFFSIISTIYYCFLFKSRKVLIESSNQAQADLIVEEMKRIIESNEWLMTKSSSTKWRSDMIGYNGGFVLAKGFGSEVRGLHLDRIVIDDILRSDNKLSDIEIEDFIDMVLDPMLLNRKGQMILVGTPMSESDIFTTVFERARTDGLWTIKRFPAIIDYDKQLIQCPHRFTWDDIMQKRLSMGPLKFAREYQLEFFSRDESLFPFDIVKRAKEKGKELRMEYEAKKRDPNWIYVGGIDVARSGSVSADYSVCFMMAYNTINQDKELVYMWREKGVKITDQARKIYEISKRFEHPYFLVEQNNIGIDLLDELIDTWNVNVEGFITGGKGQKKEELIRFLIQAFEREQIALPQGDQRSRDMVATVEDELAKFRTTRTPAGNEKFEGVGAHDDCVMALALVNRATQNMGIPFAVGEGGGDSGGGGYGSGFDTLIKKTNTRETDLVNMIRLGLIK